MMARAPLRFWLITVAAVVVAATTFSLGQWQLRRAAQKEALQASIVASASRDALDSHRLAALSQPDAALHQPVRLAGTWLGERTVYLDNRPMDGKVGFWVMTPLALEGSGRHIVVQRGWVPRNFTDRTRLPDIQTPSGVVTVDGRIAPPPSKLYEFKGGDADRIRQNLDLGEFSTEIGVSLLPVTVLQTGPASEGLLRDWAPPALGVEKNYGYAFQWFGMCAVVVALYLWFQLISPLRARRTLLNVMI